MEHTDPGAPKILSLKEIAELLVKHFDYHEGLYEIALGIQLSTGRVAPTPSGQPLPGVALGISAIGLARAAVAGTDTVDAAQVNPAK
jgi:hypothetical protein